jgi:hypothetical protein
MKNQRQTLFKPARGKSPLDRSAAADAQNLSAARFIQENRVHYLSECRFLIDWSERVLARLAPTEVEFLPTEKGNYDRRN